VVISGGGTGGHIFPALSIADGLERKGVRTIYIGSNSGIEKRIARREWMYLLPIIGWVDRNTFGKVEFILRFIPSFFSSLFILLRYRPKAILLTGGFASVPVGIAGIIYRMPIFTLILDSEPGLAVRVFSRYSEEVFLPFDSVFPSIRSLKKTVTGIPVREEILSADKNEAIKYFSLDRDKKTLLVLGGSRGAKTLVGLAEQLIPKLNPKDWQFIIQTGKHRLQINGESIKKLSFIERMGLAYALADIIISRSGALVTAEIEKTGIPTVFIPYPYAAKDHQFHNAKMAAARRNNVKVIREEDIDIDRLIVVINQLVGKRLSVEREEDATERIIKRMEGYVWKN